MNKLFSGIAMVSILLLTLTGCETDNKTLLTDGIWKFSNMTTESEDEAVMTYVAIFKAIMTDGTMEFSSDKTYIISSPLLEEAQTGTWSLIGDDQLILDGDDDYVSTANIQTLSKKELKYIETYVDQNLGTFSVTTSWKRD